MRGSTESIRDSTESTFSSGACETRSLARRTPRRSRGTADGEPSQLPSRREGMNRQDARDARRPAEPGSEIDAVASAVLEAAGLPLALVINFNVAVLLRGVRRVVRCPPAPAL